MYSEQVCDAAKYSESGDYDTVGAPRYAGKFNIELVKKMALVIKNNDMREKEFLFKRNKIWYRHHIVYVLFPSDILLLKRANSIPT